MCVCVFVGVVWFLLLMFVSKSYDQPFLASCTQPFISVGVVMIVTQLCWGDCEMSVNNAFTINCFLTRKLDLLAHSSSKLFVSL